MLVIKGSGCPERGYSIGRGTEVPALVFSYSFWANAQFVDSISGETITLCSSCWQSASTPLGTLIKTGAALERLMIK